MPSFLIIHGWHGSPSGHWQHWLAAQLRTAGHRVHFPSLPDASIPKLEPWLSRLDMEMSAIRQSNPDETCVICHSLGAVLWLHYVHRNRNTRIGRLLLVAPPGPEVAVGPLRPFFPTPLDARLVSSTARKAELVCSNADPFCPSGAKLSYGLPLQLSHHLLEDEAAHINIDSGFGPWPWVENWCLNSTSSGVETAPLPRRDGLDEP
jgi:predicted alpha/beta hydrolase family esterase